ETPLFPGIRVEPDDSPKAVVDRIIDRQTVLERAAHHGDDLAGRLHIDARQASFGGAGHISSAEPLGGSQPPDNLSVRRGLINPRTVMVREPEEVVLPMEGQASRIQPPLLAGV